MCVTRDVFLFQHSGCQGVLQKFNQNRWGAAKLNAGIYLHGNVQD